MYVLCIYVCIRLGGALCKAVTTQGPYVVVLDRKMAPGVCCFMEVFVMCVIFFDICMHVSIHARLLA